MPKLPQRPPLAPPRNTGADLPDSRAVTESTGLRAFTFHGLRLAPVRSGPDQWLGDCPFCGVEGKFYVHPETGLWDCKRCGEAGNPLTFSQRLWERSYRATATGQRAELAAQRGLLGTEALTAWGAARSLTDGGWLLPGWGATGEFHTLYRYTTLREGTGWRRALLPTPGVWPGGRVHGLFGPFATPAAGAVNRSAATVYVCEGPWDGVTLDEVLERKPVRLVVAVPSCSSFPRDLPDLLEEKEVYVLFDNDHPKVHPTSEVFTEPAGHAGVRRLAAALGKVKRVSYLRWGEGSAEWPGSHDPGLPAGHDLRDALTAGGATVAGRRERWSRLTTRVREVPPEWLAAAGGSGPAPMGCRTCTSWGQLTDAWRKALLWTEGLDRALACMLAAVLSTQLLGDQLWVKIIGPPSCGKSVLCEALSVNTEYVLAKSTIRGFHSGYRLDPTDDSEDNSLINQVRGKTLVVKDGDTLLQSPNLAQILSEGRDVYDTTSRSHYRNRAGRDHRGVRLSWVLCGTEALRRLDQSELGERFVDCVILAGADERLEEEVGWRVFRRTVENRDLLADGTAETQQEPALTRAMQLTGGYVGYLREHAAELVRAVAIDEPAGRRVLDLGRLVSYLRARPSDRQGEAAGRELSPRLVIQLTRLALCLAAVLGRRTVDGEVLRRVCRTALDTGRGYTLEICRALYRAGPPGLELASVLTATGHGEEEERNLLKFLGRIEAVRKVLGPPRPGLRPPVHYTLTPALRRLLDGVWAAPDASALPPTFRLEAD